MQYFPPALEQLVEQFAKLPGVGIKSAQRLAFHILSLPEESAAQFAQAILDAKRLIHCCPICQNLTDGEVCSVCSDAKRDQGTICVVEGPKDVSAFERTKEYHGVYHVLHGLISPMDNITPDNLKIKELLARIAKGNVNEVILATSPTVEGDATAMYISRLIHPLGIKVTRLAFGLPVGAILEYADEVTLFRALENRNEI